VSSNSSKCSTHRGPTETTTSRSSVGDLASDDADGRHSFRRYEIRNSPDTFVRIRVYTTYVYDLVPYDFRTIYFARKFAHPNLIFCFDDRSLRRSLRPATIKLLVIGSRGGLPSCGRSKREREREREKLTSYCGVGSRITDGANLHDFSNGTLLMPFLEYIVDISYILQPRDLIRP